jgi:hypothetical protein
MFAEWSPTYTPNGFIQGFEKDKIYYIGYINKNFKLQTLGVKLEQIYLESSPFGSRNDYTKLYSPYKFYKTFFHKCLNISGIKYKLDNGPYISTEFLGENELEAKIRLLRIIKDRPSNKIKSVVINIITEFAIEFPDIYLSQILNYDKMSYSYPPFIEGYSINV